MTNGMDDGQAANNAHAGREPAVGQGSGNRSVSNMGSNPAENARVGGTPYKQMTGTSPRSSGGSGKKR